MKPVYILGAKRTPIGKFQGALKSFSASDLGGISIAASLKESTLPKEAIEEVFIGQVLTAGEGQSPSRQAAIKGGLPNSVPTTLITKVCGSGLQSVIMGTRAILTEDTHLVVAGGQENMSLVPYLLPKARQGLRMGNATLLDGMVHDGLWDPYNNVHMGTCADSCAKEYKISRTEQDEFAKNSYEKAQKSSENGSFKNEIVPITLKQDLMDRDEEPFSSDLNKMPSLKPAFDKEGTITAANASKLSDGASSLILASEQSVKDRSLTPLAKILGYTSFAADPFWYTTAPVGAIKSLLKKTNQSIESIDLFEINEAFAVVPLVSAKMLQIPLEKINIHGGACALGHPIGASGARILTTLVHALKTHDKRYGIAALCIGGGEALAILIERV